jgi:predicted transcriptional regulator
VNDLLNLDSETVDQCQPVSCLCLGPDVSVADAIAQMQSRNRGMVLVCEHQGVVGIFTERDALKMMAEGANFAEPLGSRMTPRPLFLKAHDTIGRAITLMSRGGYRRLPIVDDSGHPVGIVTAEGILHFLAEQIPHLIFNLPPEPHHSAQEREGA